MKLSRKLPLAFAGIVLASLAAGLWGIWQLDRAIGVYRDTVGTELAAAQKVSELQVAFKTQVQEWKNTLLRGKDEKMRDRYWNAFVKTEADVAKEAKALQPRLPEGELRRTMADFVAAHASMAEAYRKGFEAFKAAAMDPTVGDAAVRGVDRAPTELLDKLTEKIVSESQAAVAGAARSRDRALLSSLVLMLVALAGGIAAGCFVSRSITRPVGDAVRLARAVAEGDLGSRIEPRGDDEVRELLSALATMNANLVSLVATVRSSSDSIATGSGQIAAGNTDLSQRTEEQASSLQQTASAMEELTGTVRNSTDTAQQASQLAQGASQAAGRGGEVVQQVVATMQGITDSSRRIGEIIGTIDGIAFQTNILALNAAVEAARAGEQGRGFAVVASEVRNLAQRSAVAAREIKTLIGASVEQVESGARLVDEAGNAMSDIVAQVRRVSDLIAEISAAANEQNGGLGQINDAVSQLDKMTQQNSALVEESAAAAKSLAQQAEGLVHAVSMFKLEAGAAAAPAQGG